MANDLFHSRHEALKLLQSDFEGCITALNDLARIHSDMNPLGKELQPTELESVYRMWKVRLHVKAIANWQFDMDIMHVIAPELRVASEQIDKVFKQVGDIFLSTIFDEDGKKAVQQMQKVAEARQDFVSAHVHPTPQRLQLPRGRGGLRESDDILHLCHMVVLLQGLILKYGLAVGYLSQLLSSQHEGAVGRILSGMSMESDSICMDNLQEAAVPPQNPDTSP